MLKNEKKIKIMQKSWTIILCKMTERMIRIKVFLTLIYELDWRF